MTAASAPASCPADISPGPEPGPPARRTGLRTYLPGLAGAAYLVAWITGLAAWPSNLPLNATAAQTTAAHAAHAAQAVTQYLLVEGLAGLLLGVVLGSALIAQRRGSRTPRPGGGSGLRSAGTAALATAALAVVAVGISLVQCVLGLLLTSAAAAHDVSRAGDRFTWVNHLDGVKMLAIAAAALLLAGSGGSAAALPRWLRVVTVPLAAALLVSASAYLALFQPLAWAVYVSGPLLLLWVTGLGIALTVRRRACS
jgi:hypothetical protein